MILFAFILVILSAFIHALWNLFAKQSISKITFLWSIHVISFIMLLPYFLIRLPDIQLEGYAILALLLSMSFQIFYVISLIFSYSWGDLSQTYPILRGTASILVPVISLLFFHEQLTIFGWIGLFIIFLGILSLSGGIKSHSKKETLAILIAIGGGMSITGYTLSDNILLDSLDPIMIIQFQNIFHGLAFMWGSFSSGKLIDEWKLNWKIIFLGAFFVPGSYLIFLFALQLAQVSQLGPMREINIVFGAILGTLILKEKQGRRKVWSSILIVLGIMLLSFLG